MEWSSQCQVKMLSERTEKWIENVLLERSREHRKASTRPPWLRCCISGALPLDSACTDIRHSRMHTETERHEYPNHVLKSNFDLYILPALKPWVSLVESHPCAEVDNAGITPRPVSQIQIRLFLRGSHKSCPRSPCRAVALSRSSHP